MGRASLEQQWERGVEGEQAALGRTGHGGVLSEHRAQVGEDSKAGPPSPSGDCQQPESGEAGSVGFRANLEKWAGPWSHADMFGI